MEMYVRVGFDITGLKFRKINRLIIEGQIFVTANKWGPNQKMIFTLDLALRLDGVMISMVARKAYSLSFKSHSMQELFS